MTHINVCARVRPSSAKVAISFTPKKEALQPMILAAAPVKEFQFNAVR
jgi:hypothetical protein